MGDRTGCTLGGRLVWAGQEWPQEWPQAKLNCKVRLFFNLSSAEAKKDFQRAPWGRRLALNGRDEEGKDSLGAPEGWRSLTMTAGQCHKRNRLSTREGRKVENFFSVTDGHVVSCWTGPALLHPCAYLWQRCVPASGQRRARTRVSVLARCREYEQIEVRRFLCNRP